MKNLIFFLTGLMTLSSCIGNMNPNGPAPKDYPYFITTKNVRVKNIVVPSGTKLEYEDHFFTSGKQNKMMDENKLVTIEFLNDKTIHWGGVPVASITKFYNTAMSGFSVHPNFEKLNENSETTFSDLWQSCHNDLGILVKDTDDWSFNTKNITDITSCGVSYQRYFKDNEKQQRFLDSLYTEMMKNGSGGDVND